MICAFIALTYACFSFLKRARRAKWETLRELYKIKFALIAGLIYSVKDIYGGDAEPLRSLTAVTGAFISAKTPAETIAAVSKARAVLKDLDETLKKYPPVFESGGYSRFRDENIKIDEKINFASDFYDASVKKFNAAINKMPFAVVAGIFGIKPAGLTNTY